MQTKTPKLSIQTYLDFAALLKEYRGEHQENRIFALREKILSKDPLMQLLAWGGANRFKATSAPDTLSYVRHLSAISSMVMFISLILGFLTGVGLLSYSGAAPVNIIYYLGIVTFLPILSMIFSFLSILVGGELSHFFRLFFPMHWVEKLLAMMPSKHQEFLMTLPPSLNKWMFLERLQRFSLLFSLGTLLALFVMVIIKDIAFGWSTTLEVSATSFQQLLSWMALPWHTFLPSAVPSLELVEMSHYFRLGEHLNSEMVAHADKLGAWWQFLAMSTVTYGVVLRFLFWLLVRFGYKKALKRAFLSLDGVAKILHEFQTPYVSTKAPQVEKHLEIYEETDEQVIHEDVAQIYHDILGWNFSSDEIVLANDSKAKRGTHLFSVGGSNSFSEDEAIAEGTAGVVLLYVKSWEPPTMDFVDFLEMLIENSQVERIEIYPLGTVGRYYESEEREVAVWKRKIQGLKSDKVWVVDA